MMKDLHSHLLYGIDDGCRSIEESIDLLKQMSESGVKEIIITPHYIENSKYTCDNNYKKVLLVKLKEKVKEENIDVTLYLGNEVFYTDKFLDLIKKNEIATLNGSKYILFEFPMHNNYRNVGEIMSLLISKGYTPILAHPERYRKFQEQPELVEEYLRMGLLLQGNYTSLFGKYGHAAKKTLKYFIKKGWISFLGSDVHHDWDYNEKKLLRKLHRLNKDEQYIHDLLEGNFDRVIRNEEIGLIR